MAFGCSVLVKCSPEGAAEVASCRGKSPSPDMRNSGVEPDQKSLRKFFNYPCAGFRSGKLGSRRAAGHIILSETPCAGSCGARSSRGPVTFTFRRRGVIATTLDCGENRRILRGITVLRHALASGDLVLRQFPVGGGASLPMSSSASCSRRWAISQSCHAPLVERRGQFAVMVVRARM